MANEKRLIDAISLREHMAANFQQALWLGCDDPIYSVAAETIEDAPTVDAVEVVHGRWTAHKPDCRGYTSGFICSICGDIVYTDYSMKECIYNYCPNCGAKMDGGHEYD